MTTSTGCPAPAPVTSVVVPVTASGAIGTDTIDAPRPTSGAAFGGVMAVLTHVPRPIFRKLPF